jgi:hypothetical protein
MKSSAFTQKDCGIVIIVAAEGMAVFANIPRPYLPVDMWRDGWSLQPEVVAKFRRGFDISGVRGGIVF